MTALKSIAPREAADLVRKGAVLIDIREDNERAREQIPGTVHRALSSIEKSGTLGAAAGAAHHKTLIFHCRTGMRTQANAEALADAASCEAYILEGGLEAWKTAGLPVKFDRTQPIEIMRQVQIAAGSLVLLGVILGFTAHPAFFALSGAVGGGLVFAGVSGFCGMARLLALMPWNRRSAPKSA